MLRRLFAILSVVSLLLCGASLLLWATAVPGRPVATGPLNQGRWAGQSGADGLLIQRRVETGRMPPEPYPLMTPKYEVIGEWRPAPGLVVYRFQFTMTPLPVGSIWGPRPPAVYRELRTVAVVDHRLAAGVFGVLPLAHLAGLAVRRARRRPAGTCVKCGYDLRMTPDRCPECGAVA